MAVHIRLMRFGKRKQPSYRIVVVDSRFPRGGAYIEALGHYNPLPKEPVISVNFERYEEWVKSGAVPTLTVKKLIKKVK